MYSEPENDFKAKKLFTKYTSNGIRTIVIKLRNQEMNTIIWTYSGISLAE